MPRRARCAPGGLVYHALNRATARLKLFRKPADYDALLRVLEEALRKHPCRVLAFCLMPTHWHFVLWPQADGELTAFLRWLTHTHTMRWHTHYHSVGSGHLYQGRFKSFPIQADDHLYTVLRYIERNPLRARLVKRAEAWPWSSLGLRERDPERAAVLLAPWPLPRPRNWPALVNAAQSEAELKAVRGAMTRSRPYGVAEWAGSVASQLGLQHTLRPRGRPRKEIANAEEEDQS